MSGAAGTGAGMATDTGMGADTGADTGAGADGRADADGRAGGRADGGAAPRLLVHVGFHKTATSWLQQRLFTPEHGYAPVAGHEEVDRLLTRPHGLAWDPAPMRAHLAAAAAALEPGLVPVVSSEILSGHPFFGGHESDAYAHRLHRVAPEARILIGIRAQSRILPSVYMQYLLRGGTMTPRQFFDGETDLGYAAFSADHFEYDRLVAHYQGLFGRDRVMVLQQEALARDADAAAARLAAFAGAGRFKGLLEAARAPYAPSYPEHAAPVLRRINHVQASTLNPRPIVALGRTPGGLYRAAGFALRRPPLAGLLQRRRPASEHVARRFAGRFAQSNRRLARIAHTPPAGPLDMTGYD